MAVMCKKYIYAPVSLIFLRMIGKGMVAHWQLVVLDDME